MCTEPTSPSTSAQRENPSLRDSCCGVGSIDSRRFRWCTVSSSVVLQPASRSGPAQSIIQPPSTSRLAPFIAGFSSRKSDASTMSLVVTWRPVGVRASTAASAASLPLQKAVSATIPGVQRVHAHRRELDRERPHERRDGAVDRRHGRRARVRPVLREPAEDQDRGVGGEAVGELVDDLGVADELHRREPDRALDVVVADGVLVAQDRGHDEPVDVAEPAKRRGDRVRVGDVDGDAARAAPELGRDRLRACRVAPADRDARAALDVRLGERAAEAGRPADDHDLARHASILQSHCTFRAVPFAELNSWSRRARGAARDEASEDPLYSRNMARGEPCEAGSDGCPDLATLPESVPDTLGRADPAGAPRSGVQRARARRADGGLAEPDLADRARPGDAVGGNALGGGDRARASRSATCSTARSPPPRSATSPAEAPVQRHGTRKAITLAGGVRWERLTPGPDNDVEFIHVVYPPGAESCPPDSLSRHGGKEYGFVVSGTLGVQIGFESYVVHANDSVSFESTRPHRLWAIGDEPAVAVWTVVNRRGGQGESFGR